MANQRCAIRNLIDEARATGARQSEACKIMGISAKTYQRWSKPGNVDDRRIDSGRSPPNKLSEMERQRLLKVANEPEYANLPPCKIVPHLADKGCYLASEATFYRVLKDEKQLSHRQSSKPIGTVRRPRALVASAPNQIYCWDITYLPSTVRGLFYYLYLVMDIYSRKIVGWQVYEQESSALAADLMIDICCREGIAREQVTLHSDNGSPMKGATMLATLQQLGVMPSFSRPGVSNDNPYSESLFRTLKYQPAYPVGAFTDLLSVRRWVNGFVNWYNNEHLHSGIKFVTPTQRHSGLDREILEKRTRVYQEARRQNPKRWSGDIRNWTRVNKVYLNPEKAKHQAA